jgi:hypothetical protein
LQTIGGGKFVLHGGNDGTRIRTNSCGNTLRIVLITDGNDCSSVNFQGCHGKQISLDVINVGTLREIHLTKVCNCIYHTPEHR